MGIFILIRIRGYLMGMKCISVGNLNMFSSLLVYRNLIKNIENFYEIE